MNPVLGYDPRTGEPVGQPVEETSPDAVNSLVKRAAAAVGPWTGRADEARADALEAVAAALDAATDELAALADAETALGETRLRGEVGRSTHQLRMFVDLLRDGSYVEPVISPADPALGRPDVRRMLTAIGPVAVFAASNFPFAFSVPGGDTASALAAGCPVIVKAHEGHPLTSKRTEAVIANALIEVGAPEGTFGVVYGVDAGRALILHPLVRAVGFTGSTSGGRILFDLASGRPDPIPFYGELGSVNPVIVLPGAAHARATAIAQGYAGSLTLGVGQFCTKPGLMFVPTSDTVLAAIRAAVADTHGGPMLTHRMHDGYRAAITKADWTGLELLGQGRRDARPAGQADDDVDGQWAVAPEVRVVSLTDFVADAERLAQERFGPAGLVVTYDDIEGLLPVLAHLPGSLTASVHADEADIEAAGMVAETLRPLVGRFIMNGWPTGVAVCWAMQHGGPWPASTNAAHTSVGTAAIHRWITPIAYQDWPDALLPPALQAANPMNLRRLMQP